MANWQIEPESPCYLYTLGDGTSILPEHLSDSFTETGRNLDVAIIGEGFFQCTDPLTGEIFYTRWGRFGINGDTYLMHAEPCEPVNGDAPILLEGPFGINGYGNSMHTKPFVGRLLEPVICFPEGTQSVQIHDDGMVWVTLNADDHQSMCVGMIELATFNNPEGLEQVGETLYRPTAASGRATVNQPGINGTGVLKMGYLERKR
jgi:flagellar basal-body rod protein FlgG